ncbi:MAG TPA: hypothetical protein VNK23_17375 [Candidatus Dormibacteraeota bacterium]|nr:hypothetical protein [Candidatus Dormibacteraeota bacterium]
MDDVPYSCPICHGSVLFEDMSNPRVARTREALITQKLYCPHCEMLVEPVVTSAEQREHEGVAGHDAGTDNHGRSRQGGSNAGGSQRGDLSDEGATQWRSDPEEVKRNTWEDKP